MSTLVNRLTQHNVEAAALVAEGVMLLALEVERIEDEATAFDYAVAVDELLTALGADGEMIANEHERPESDDNRSLFERLRDDRTGAAGRIAMTLMGLTLIAHGIRGEGNAELADDYRTVLHAFVRKIKGEDEAPAEVEVKAQFKVKKEGDAA